MPIALPYTEPGSNRSVRHQRAFENTFMDWDRFIPFEVAFSVLDLDARLAFRTPSSISFKVEWNDEEQLVLFDGAEVATEIVLLGNTAFAPIRDLVESAGLEIKVDVPNHKVTVSR